MRTLISKVRGNQIYLEKIQLGEKVSSILDKGVVREESLNKEHKYALDLFRKQRPQFDISSIQLRPWQEDALKLINYPSEREVIWITDTKGDTGKTWFQKYVESYFGFHRVFRADLRIKHTSLCYILQKRTFASIDIFLFNDARSISGEDLNMYRILEDIKDGQATASKYNNEIIRMKTPNILMVFSNKLPNLKKLSRDRWTIYHPNKDGLTARMKESPRSGNLKDIIKEKENLKINLMFDNNDCDSDSDSDL